MDHPVQTHLTTEGGESGDKKQMRVHDTRMPFGIGCVVGNFVLTRLDGPTGVPLALPYIIGAVTLSVRGLETLVWA